VWNRGVVPGCHDIARGLVETMPGKNERDPTPQPAGSERLASMMEVAPNDLGFSQHPRHTPKRLASSTGRMSDLRLLPHALALARHQERRTSTHRRPATLLQLRQGVDQFIGRQSACNRESPRRSPDKLKGTKPDRGSKPPASQRRSSQLRQAKSRGIELRQARSRSLVALHLGEVPEMRFYPFPTNDEAAADMRRRKKRRQIWLGRRAADDQVSTRLELRQLPGEKLEARKVVLGLQRRLRCCAR
jgi:hypothetical protein